MGSWTAFLGVPKRKELNPEVSELWQQRSGQPKQLDTWGWSHAEMLGIVLRLERVKTLGRGCHLQQHSSATAV